MISTGRTVCWTWTASRLQAALARCEAEKRPRAKCYAALGLCTGLALLILAV